MNTSLSSWLPSLPARAPTLEALRQEGAQAFSSRGFPTSREEAFRFTDLGLLLREPFAPLNGHVEEAGVSDTLFARVRALSGPRLVFVDGRFVAPLSSEVLETLRPLSQALTSAEDVEVTRDRPGFLVSVTENGFVALNQACLEEGAILSVPPGVQLRTPILLIHVVTGSQPATAIHPRTLLHLEAGSSATVLELYLGQGRTLTNAVLEAQVDEQASLELVRVIEGGGEAFHVSHAGVLIGANGRARASTIALGGALCRSHLEVSLRGEGAEASLAGLSLGASQDVLDQHTYVRHLSPHGLSQQAFKTILADRSAGIFDGKIEVAQGALQTDARQNSRTLLLSSDAKMNAQPRLEILADDVKCTHGATVGQLDPEQLFYLRSRGIGETEARQLLVEAFANDLELAREPAVASWLREEISRRMRVLSGGESS